MFLRTIALFSCLLFITNFALAQETATYSGVVKDLKSGKELAFVNIGIYGSSKGTSTDEKGKFSMELPVNQELRIDFTSIGYLTKSIRLKLRPNQKKNQLVYLKQKEIQIDTVEILDKSTRRNPVIKIDPKISTVLANPTGNFEAILKGNFITVRSELSSQYLVRGGNFDENLVYVNDIEIYRPLLTRQGQQEGMSFINPDMVQSIEFSAGGFEARFGDKLSSVLDIKYKKPDSLRVGFNASLLGGGFHVEGASKNKKLRHISAFRYRTLSNLVNTLDTKGDYKPSATDLQSYITYLPDPKSLKWEFGLLASYNRNRYLVIPQDRETDFGTIQTALRLRVFFGGREITEYETFTSGATAIYRPNNRTELKLIASTYLSDERENFDVEGAYLLDVVDNDFGSDDFGEVAFNIGAGGFHNYGRNQLQAKVFSLEHKGSRDNPWGFLRWGLRFQHENLEDKLFEWRQIDSAAFAIPYTGDTVIQMEEFINARNQVRSNRLLGYVQNSWTLNELKDMFLTFGVRGNYWSFSNEFLLSPRLQFSYRPTPKKDWVLKAAGGIYVQPPFYREMRNLEGRVNENIKAQKSIQAVVGSDLVFKIWDRDFKFITEAYYKHLSNIIPYEIDNVRIRYYADQRATGYATGIDFRINGQFVRSLESWASLSFLRTQEDIIGDFFFDEDSVRQEIGFIRRPTDQRFNFNIMFQDFLPKNPTFKVSLSLVYGAEMPYSVLRNPRFRNTFTIPAYRRVDIGFSKQVIGKGAKFKTQSFLRHFDSLWFNAEVFNLLQIQNTISYIWVQDTGGNRFGVPNYLTNRQLNIRLVASF